MSGVYIHIPFCKSKCKYCDFYSVTALNRKKELMDALCREICERSEYLNDRNISSLYFGGGTPSLLSYNEIIIIYDQICKHYNVQKDAEITYECNPDDLKKTYLKELSELTPVNRLSIGVQSFNDNELKFLKRRHNSFHAKNAVYEAKQHGFENISIDLIYGIPGMTTDDCKENIQRALELNVPHISAYHLSYEQGTLLYEDLQKKKFVQLSGIQSQQQYMLLVKEMKNAGYIHYEISNFAKDGYFSKHNMKYWMNKEYIGLGPSAHSYNLESRQWNISDIDEYIRCVNMGYQYFKHELLNKPQQYNEYLLTGLRTNQGVSANRIQDFGTEYYSYFVRNSARYIREGLIKRNKDQYCLSEEAMFLSDTIISDLMRI